MKISAIIPARFASTRLPGKPILEIFEKPMIQWVFEAAKKSKFLDEVIIATDDIKIFEVCKKFTSSIVMTNKNHISGTDRIAEVAKDLDSNLIVNIQGDEPLITAPVIDILIEVMQNSSDLQMGSLARDLKNEEISNPNIVKVLINDCNRADKFFRRIEARHEKLINSKVYAHIGIYAYKRDFLLKYSSLKESQGEIELRLEQLRALESGYQIGIGLVQYEGIGVDTIEDLQKVEKILKEKNDNVEKL